MRAAVGDWLHMDGRAAGQPQRAGQIIEIRGADGEPPYLVRFRDGRTSLVIPGPGAVIRYSGLDESAPAAAAIIDSSGLDEPALAAGLMFRVTGRQRREMLSIATVIAGAAALLAGLAAAAPNPGRLAAWAAGAGVAALITVYYAVAYATAYTECTPAGLRVRDVTWRRSLPWARLRDIAIRDYGSPQYRYRRWYRYPYLTPSSSKQLRIVIVTADDGARFWLGAPIDGGQGWGDPEFEHKVSQIRYYWRSSI